MKDVILPGEGNRDEDADLLGKEEKMKRLPIVILSIFLLAGVFGLGERVQAAEYPVKPITFIIPLGPGADADVFHRPFCQNLTKLLGKPVVVVNKPGAGSSIGYREIHDAKPDGYTIGVGAAITLVTNKLQGISPS